MDFSKPRKTKKEILNPTELNPAGSVLFKKLRHHSVLPASLSERTWSWFGPARTGFSRPQHAPPCPVLKETVKCDSSELSHCTSFYEGPTWDD